jgi:hypothetical protein
MDAFDPDDHAAIKGALVACMQGKWTGHTLHASALVVSGHHPSLEFQLVRAEFDGEPCVQVVVPAKVADAGEYERKLAEALQSDPATGFLHRRNFVEKLRGRLGEPAKGGVRCIGIRRAGQVRGAARGARHPDGRGLPRRLRAACCASSCSPATSPAASAATDSCCSSSAATPRTSRPGPSSWVHKVATEVFQAGAKSMSTTCTIGLGPVPAEVRAPDGPATTPSHAHRQGRDMGGNRVQLLEHTGALLRLQDQDRLWVKQIKAALMENRFRLVQQPIASLVGEDLGMFDVLVRMLDEQGQEVLPSVFMPAAERNDLMKNIDRWVIGAAMSFCAARKPGALFVRVSRETRSPIPRCPAGSRTS